MMEGYSYYAKNYSGLEDNFETKSPAEMVRWLHEKVSKGHYCVFKDDGDEVRLSPAKYDLAVRIGLDPENDWYEADGLVCEDNSNLYRYVDDRFLEEWARDLRVPLLRFEQAISDLKEVEKYENMDDNRLKAMVRDIEKDIEENVFTRIIEIIPGDTGGPIRFDGEYIHYNHVEMALKDDEYYLFTNRDTKKDKDLHIIMNETRSPFSVRAEIDDEEIPLTDKMKENISKNLIGGYIHIKEREREVLKKKKDEDEITYKPVKIKLKRRDEYDR